jgi:hypothetical protein
VYSGVFWGYQSLARSHMEKIRAMAKQDMLEDLCAVYGDSAADELKSSGTVTLVEMMVTDERGDEHLLDSICIRKY